MNKKILIIASIILFLVSTSISYYLLSGHQSAGSTTSNTGIPTNAKINNDYQKLTFDPNAPKTEECPINGVLYSKDQANWWAKHRPLGVMIENHSDARPQSGIPFSDITYEAVAEGGHY